MHKETTPRRISMTEMVSSDSNFNNYSLLYDTLIEQLSYENRKYFNADIWQLNYI